MKPADLVERLSERPFVPLRIYLSNGRSHDVLHPEMAIVSRDIVAIGIALDESPPVAESIRLCSISHITEVEPLPVG
jgi:hypothetical protein